MPTGQDLLDYEGTCGFAAEDLPFRVLSDRSSAIPGLFPGSNSLPMGAALDRQMIVRAKGDGASNVQLQSWVLEALEAE